MRAELERARGLKFVNLESPYFAEASVDEVTGFSVSATLGGLLAANRSHFRSPRVQVRVGSLQIRQHELRRQRIYLWSNYDVDRLPLENNYDLLRRYLWLAIDRAYKSAVESIARKRAALKNISIGEQPDDFTKAAPVKTGGPGAASYLR